MASTVYITVDGDDHAQNSSTMSLPSETFTETAAVYGMIHRPRTDFSVLVAGPYQPTARINYQTHGGRGVSGLVEGCRLVVAASAAAAAAGTKPIGEVPEPYAALLPRPQLRLRAGDGPEEPAHLRLAQRVRSELQRRRAAEVHCGPLRHPEDPGAAAAPDELRQAAVADAGRRHRRELPVEKLAGVLRRVGAPPGVLLRGPSGREGVGAAVVVARHPPLVQAVLAQRVPPEVGRVADSTGADGELLAVEVVLAGWLPGHEGGEGVLVQLRRLIRRRRRVGLVAVVHRRRREGEGGRW